MAPAFSDHNTTGWTLPHRVQWRWDGPTSSPRPGWIRPGQTGLWTRPDRRHCAADIKCRNRDHHRSGVRSDGATPLPKAGELYEHRWRIPFCSWFLFKKADISNRGPRRAVFSQGAGPAHRAVFFGHPHDRRDIRLRSFSWPGRTRDWCVLEPDGITPRWTDVKLTVSPRFVEGDSGFTHYRSRDIPF